MGVIETLCIYWAIKHRGRLVEEWEDKQKSPEERRRRDRRTPRIAICRYAESPFVFLFQSGDDQALLNCCGVDHKVFRDLLQLFAPAFNSYTVDKNNEIVLLAPTRSGKKMGKPREADATCCLGLVLFWYRTTRGSVARGMAMAFGLTSTVMYKWIKFSMRILLSVLHKHPLAMVNLPSEQEINEYVRAIGAKYPRLQRVWAAADGLKTEIQSSEDWLKQEVFFNGWKGDTYVNGVFVFAPDGRIRIGTFNCPGTWHDSTISDYGIYDKMETLDSSCAGGARVVVDSAFGLLGRPFLIQSSQTDPEGEEQLLLNRDTTSLRQMSEWGMRMIQNLDFLDYRE